MNPTRLVILTGDGPEHHYVANRICAAHEIDAILVADPPTRRSWQKVLRQDPMQVLDKALWHLYLRAISDMRARATGLSAVLGPESDDFARPDVVIRVGGVKGKQLAATMKELAPEVIAVYGTGVVPDAVLGCASKIALNMHTGLSPWYRGAACAFWPVVNGDLEKIGATVHECTSEVDGGAIYFTGRANLYQGDDLHMIFARAVKVGADGYVAVLEDVKSGTLAGRTQDLRLGREYRGSMRGIRAELTARWRLRKLSRHWPPAPPSQIPHECSKASQDSMVAWSGTDVPSRSDTAAGREEGRLSLTWCSDRANNQPVSGRRISRIFMLIRSFFVKIWHYIKEI